MSSELEIDEMVEDLYGQEHPKKRKDLRDIPQYQNAINEDDFDITYRTPRDLIDSPKKENLQKHLLPDEYTFVKDLDKYDEQIMKSHNLPYEKPTRPGREVIGIYDKDIDTIIAGSDTDNTTLAHEFFHQKHRRAQKQTARVMSEPTFKGFKHTSKPQIEKDFFSTLDSTYPDAPKKARTEDVTMIKKLPYYEQLAEFTQFPREIANPKTKTGKVLNRLWFE